MIELAFLPDGHTAATVTTTVWVGVCVVVAFHLRFGWTVSGLVVPGYLVPLMMVRPVSVLVVLLEAVVTYGIVLAISTWGKRHSEGCILFGRDRFFLITLVSVLVRVATDGWLLPIGGQWFNETFHLNFRYADELHSVGLVIVALIANYFWKPGFIRGIGPLVFTTLLTFLIVRYGLIEFTSFDIGNLRYVYDDIAASLLASPKAYIVLLTTAWIASHMNLRYAWDYNGILIPSLLALHWCFPIKILATLAESFLVLGMAYLVLRIPMFRRKSIVGARQLLLFFTIALAYRMVLAWTVPLVYPDWKVTDTHGFGYLLSTLLAIRFYNKGHIATVCQATLNVSFAGALVGSLVGFVLMALPLRWHGPLVLAAPRFVSDTISHETLYDTLKADKLRLYETPSSAHAPPPSNHQLSTFRNGLRALQPIDSQAVTELDVRKARSLFDQINYELTPLREFFYLHDRQPDRNWGTFAVRRGSGGGLLISVPYPTQEPFTYEAAALLMHQLGADALAIAHDVVGNPSHGRMSNRAVRDTLCLAFHQELGDRNTLQIRSYARDNARWFESLPSENGPGSVDQTRPDDQLRSSLWISGGLPVGLDLSELESLLDGIQLTWGPSPLPNAVRSQNTRTAELFLDRDDLTHLYAQGIFEPSNANQNVQEIQGRLIPWLLERKEAIARGGSESYQPATQEELLFLDGEVIRPLLDVAHDGLDSEEAHQRLKVLSDAAARTNYQISHFHESVRQADYLILSERQPEQKFWGTYVFRVAPETPFVWEIPHPLFERNSFEFGVASFVRERSSALLVPGAHRSSNQDRSADVVPTTNRLTLFNLVHQALLFKAREKPLLVVQCRAIRDPIDCDVTFACDDGARGRNELTPLKRDLYDRLARKSSSIAFVDGSSETAGYELGNSAQLASLHFTPHKEFVGLWLAQSLRSQFRRQSNNVLLLAQVRAAGIEIIESDLLDVIQTSKPAKLDESVFAELQQDLTTFLSERDVLQLIQAKRRWSRFHWTLVMDQETQSAVLVIATSPNDLDSPRLVVKLTEIDEEDGVSIMHAHQWTQATVDRYFSSKKQWLVRSEAP